MQRHPMSMVQPKQTEAELLNQINQLKSELSFQVNANGKLSKELNECLKRLGITRVDVIHQDINHQTDLSYLAPLFIVYEDHIKNYDVILQKLMDDLAAMDARIQMVNDDNTFLRKQLQEKNEQFLRLYQQGGGSANNIKNVFNELEKDDLEERIRLLNEENSIYVNKLKQYESQIQDLQLRNDQMFRNEQQYLNQLQDLKQLNQNLEIGSDDLKIKLDILENKFQNQTQLVAITEEEKTEYIQRFSKSENENKVLKHQNQNLKQEIVNLQNKGQLSQTELSKELEEMHKKERELFDKQVHNEREIDQLRDENRALKRELDQCKSNLEQTIKMMDNYENKISILLKKEENYKILTKQLKEERENAVMEKDRYQLKEQQFDQTLQNQMSKHREEIINIKENFDKQSDSLKNRYKIIIEQREDEIHRLNEEANQITTLNDRLTKEIKSLKIEITRMENGLKSDIETNYQQTDDLQRQISELTEKNTLLEQKLTDQEAEFSLAKQSHDSYVKTLTNNNADLKQNLEHTRSELTSRTQELSTQKGKINSLTRQCQNQLEELAKTKRHYESRLEQIQDDYTYKIKNLQLQMEDAINRERQSREKSVKLLQDYDKIEEKLKVEYNSRISELETTINNLKSMNHQLTLKLNEIRNVSYMNKVENSTLRKGQIN
ncbi:unnamed protein product [Paramecium pentaurelia]|uniref:Uncharacterized protein n=1 Tax=Paramecium pentaurelia TaxID=43138 RepID=A0A8S1TY76_9CILI|nr:unnamed protein product [Paramecium pentaurelia]